MTGGFADRLFRIAFALAGAYNLAFGLWAAVWPLAFFQLFDIPPPRYAGIWACLGMVVGVYGLLYWHAAWKLECAWPIIAVGLLGKVLGPIGMATSFSDDWPWRLGMICVFNDLIWWLPFGLFLVRGTAFGRRIAAAAPWLCIALHAVALATTAWLLKPGTIMETDPAARASFIAAHEWRWSIGWTMWMLAAASYVGFCAWWASRIDTVDERSSGATPATIAVVIAALGTIFDFSGEGSLILLGVERARELTSSSVASADLTPFFVIERVFMWLSAGAANGLYTVAGIILTLRMPGFPRWIRTLMWLTWVAGITMTLAGVANYVACFVASSIFLFPPFLVWIAWMGAFWPGAQTSGRRPA